MSICSSDSDVIDDDGRRIRFVGFSDDDDLINVFDEGTDGVRCPKINGKCQN